MMGLVGIRIPNGIVHILSSDAVFRNSDGEAITMRFHPYCGPSFESRDGEPIYPPEHDMLWDQFNGWWVAKGREKYSSDRPRVKSLLNETESRDI